MKNHKLMQEAIAHNAFYVKHIIEHLDANDPTLTSVGLSYVSMAMEDWVKIGKCLEKNTVLRDLSLPHYWGDDLSSLTAFAESLKKNTTLVELYFSSHSLGDKGAVIVADALKNNKTLKSVVMAQNDIGAEGAKALADALKINTSLEFLSLHHNPLQPEGVRAILDALRTNSTATVNFTDTSLSSEFQDSVDDRLHLPRGKSQKPPTLKPRTGEVLFRDPTKEWLASAAALQGASVSDSNENPPSSMKLGL